VFGTLHLTFRMLASADMDTLQRLAKRCED
jgi:hypothetical protein